MIHAHMLRLFLVDNNLVDSEETSSASNFNIYFEIDEVDSNDDIPQIESILRQEIIHAFDFPSEFSYNFDCINLFTQGL